MQENVPMNLRRWVWLIAIVLLVVLTVSACAKKIPPPPPPPPAPPAAPAPPPPPPPAPAPAPAPPAAPKPLTEEETFARKTLEQLNAEMPLGDVLFDYDQAAVREDQRAGLQKNADWLRRWSSTRVTIEGHADARGTNEYNLALGEKRGNVVKDYLVTLGIAADRMSVISKGEESPLCTEMSDACYARNRRGHFIITAK
jgi:peptidoglycan-associated lipoprotein